MLIPAGALRPRKPHRQENGREDGQALIEFIVLLPIVLMFMWYVVHINVAINKSIVGQKHARSQLFLKMFNHRSGPLYADIATTERSDFYIGVSGAVVAGGNGVHPVAPTEMLGVGMSPKANPAASDDPGEPPPGTMRQRIRIRTVFGICTHRKKMASGLSDFCAVDRNAN
jgi:hypothetical protein